MAPSNTQSSQNSSSFARELAESSPDASDRPSPAGNVVSALSTQDAKETGPDTPEADDRSHADNKVAYDDTEDLFGNTQAKWKRSNPDFHKWADAAATPSLPEWHVNAARQLMEVPEAEMPYRQRFLHQTGEDNESDTEEEKAARERVSPGHGAHVFAQRSTQLQSTRILPEEYEAREGRANPNGEPYWSNQDFRQMQDMFLTGEVPNGERGGRQWAVRHPGVGLIRSTDPIQDRTPTEAEIEGERIFKEVDRATEHKQLFVSVRSDFNVLGGRGEYENTTGAHETIGPEKYWRDPDCRFQMTDTIVCYKKEGPKFWNSLEAYDKKFAQLAGHNLVMAKATEYGPVPLDENGDPLLGHDREVQLAGQAIQSFAYDPSEYELDAKLDPLIRECWGVGKKGGVGKLKVKISRQSEVKGGSFTLVEATRLCEEADWKKSGASKATGLSDELQASGSETETPTKKRCGKATRQSPTRMESVAGALHSFESEPIEDEDADLPPEESSFETSMGATNAIQEAEETYYHTEPLEGPHQQIYSPIQQQSGPTGLDRSSTRQGGTSLTASQRMRLLLEEFRLKEVERSRQARVGDQANGQLFEDSADVSDKKVTSSRVPSRPGSPGLNPPDSRYIGG